jgi:hypothetical protein
MAEQIIFIFLEYMIKTHILNTPQSDKKVIIKDVQKSTIEYKAVATTKEEAMIKVKRKFRDSIIKSTNLVLNEQKNLSKKEQLIASEFGEYKRLNRFLDSSIVYKYKDIDDNIEATGVIVPSEFREFLKFRIIEIKKSILNDRFEKSFEEM